MTIKNISRVGLFRFLELSEAEMPKGKPKIK